MKLSGDVSILALALALLANPVLAQTTGGPDGAPGPADQDPKLPTTPADEADGTTVGEIVVTGSRIARDVRTASVPVATVGQEAFQAAGAVNAEELLNTLPQFVPATTSASNSLASATGTGAATIDLRGLGPARNLVLVNGRRYIFFDASQVTNINAIPTALIKRTEVVTGGASAVYGSDAIAGVVNFILRDDFEGVEARAQYNIDSRGDGGTTDLTLTMGGDFADDRGNAVLSINYADRDSIMTADREFSSVNLSDVTVNGQRVLGPGGSSFVPNGRFFGLPSTPAAIAARPGLAAAYASAGLTGLTANGFIPDDTGRAVRSYNPSTDFFDYSVDNFLRVPQERLAITGLADYDLNERLTAYVEGAYSNNQTTVGFASSFINETLPVEVNNPFIGPALRSVLALLDQTETGAAANDGRVSLGFARRLSELGPRLNVDDRDAYRVLAGLRGDIGDVSETFLTDLTFDAYYSFSRSKNVQTQTGNASRARFAQGILSGSGPNGQPAVNPFGPNISDAGVAYIEVDSTNVDITELQVASASVSGVLTQVPAGALGFSLGTEWRSSSADFDPDQLLAIGDVAGFNPITPTSGEINVREVFGEIRAPIIADRPFFEELTLNAAARYSDYDLEQVGQVATYQAGVDWRINSDFSVGGQYQRAIRAPNVGEAFGGTRTFPVAATDPCSLPAASGNTVLRNLCIATGVPSGFVGTAALQPNAQIPGVLGGNPALEAEESDTYTASLLWTPSFAPRFRLSLDYYDISVTGAISPLAGGVNSVLDLCYNQIRDVGSVACRAVARNPVSGAIDTDFPVTALNENLGKLETSGVDLQISYRVYADFGLRENSSRFDLLFNAGWVNEFTVTPVQELPNRKNFCLGAFGPTCGEPKFEYKTSTRVTWTSGPLSLSARHRWLDSVDLDVLVLPARRGETSPAASTEAVPSLESTQYVDLSFQYDFSERLVLNGGVNNLFDQEPPLLGTRQRRANTFPDTYDAFGTEFFVGATVKF